MTATTIVKLTRIQSCLFATAEAAESSSTLLREQVALLSDGLCRVQSLVREIGEVSAALDTLQQLLDTAEANHFSGDQMHSLIGPIHAKLADSLEGLERVL
ncbi:hypothetical protein [Pseudomonas sp. UBA4194]|uniref:hypothetical protein n=1 Tax=Pseudomonas sp. UBA4194 TaxID=1947317 RepID=UPI0025EC4B79|nr:hypothetical protein [Pseudomonas sp. UBA4194]